MTSDTRTTSRGMVALSAAVTYPGRVEPVAWLATILFVALLVGAWHLARRSEEHNEYIDETHHHQPRDPPISGTGFLG